MSEEWVTPSLPDAGYWLYAQGVTLPSGDSAWGRCEYCIAKEEPCFSCSVRVQPGNPPLDKAGIAPDLAVAAREALAHPEEPEPDPELVEWFKDALDPAKATGHLAHPKEPSP